MNRLPGGGRVWFLTDVTERRKMDERLNQIRKIEALGKVTGEVAHDFGNILSTISTNVFLLEKERSSLAVEQVRQRIANAVEIGTSLTERLLAFARKQHLAPEIVELNALVEGLVDLISVGLKDGVCLRTELARQPVHVQADPGQLESAILNLCLNANQAIAETGRICIGIRKGAPDTVTITVSDNGNGMDEITLSHAMEPFFSARSDGQGTGLGLSMVYGFIKQTGGDMQIVSRSGEGTSVELSLPTCDPAEMERARPGALRTALVVDDDSRILNDIAADLADLSFEVTQAASYAEGMALLSTNTPYDLVSTDIHLEEDKSGWHLAEEALKRSETTRVLVISGRLPSTHPLLQHEGDRISCLSKPVTRQNLAASVGTTGLVEDPA